jgi:serine/threonine protein kinase
LSTTGRIPGVGDVVAGYRIDEVVGSGGMGTVYRATHERLGREVAVKILRPELATDPVYRARFEREARIAAQLEHPSIVPLLDFGEQDGVLYLVVRFVHGHDLRSLLARVRSLDPQQTIGVLRQVAGALDAAHAQGLVHRDVKPANILVGAATASQRAGHAFLTDFGIAKDMGVGAGITSPGTFVGSRHYASPEQIDAKSVDGRADQYALACIAYECLTGSAPYDRDSDSAVMLAHLLEAPPSARAALETLPPGVDVVLSKALAKSPDARFETCTEMIEALEQQLERVRPPVAPPPVPEAAEPPPTPGSDETGIRLERKAEKPGRRGETELLAGGERRRPPAEREPEQATPPEVPVPAREPTPSRRKTAPSDARRRPRRARRPLSRETTLRSGAVGLALVGIGVLAAGGLTHGGKKAAPPTSSPLRARADSLSLGGQQRYTIPAPKLLANDRGKALHVVGITGRRTLHGALSLSRNGKQLVYVPDGGFSGLARFSYTVRDAAGNVGVGNVALRVHGLTAAERGLLSYLPTDLVHSCRAAPTSSAAEAGAVSCRAPVGRLTLVSYRSAKAADAAFGRLFGAAAGDCTTVAATGVWFWPGTPKRDAGRYGCAVSGQQVQFGWTYTAGRYVARLAGKRGASLAVVSRWFFSAARLKR